MDEMCDKLYVVWQDDKSRIRHVIGELIKRKTYEFHYIKYKLENIDFEPLIAFPDFDKSYSSERLFTVFSSRLPDKRRRDISEVLKHYEMDSYNEFELLKRSGGRLPIDSLEFVEPIDLCDKVIKRKFYIACVNNFYEKNKDVISSLEANMDLSYHLESNNDFDKHAVQVLIKDKVIGYIPVYFSEQVTKAVKEKREVNIKIINLKPVSDGNWHEHIKVELCIV